MTEQFGVFDTVGLEIGAEKEAETHDRVGGARGDNCAYFKLVVRAGGGGDDGGRSCDPRLDHHGHRYAGEEGVESDFESFEGDFELCPSGCTLSLGFKGTSGRTCYS
jgi:hypothetical protein